LLLWKGSPTILAMAYDPHFITMNTIELTSGICSV